MTKRTEEELLRQEKLDTDVYGSTRSMFEHVVMRYREAVADGNIERANELQTTIIDNYNSASESCQEMMGRLRRAENIG